ncbi:hypothetical protein QBC43DRAFT_351042 [Cladorrhinum sp. PSN259]|nr:hypothetical protein QBC43DRAFT_351042 [Cladorrhinum sp. PSN259]
MNPKREPAPGQPGPSNAKIEDEKTMPATPPPKAQPRDWVNARRQEEGGSVEGWPLLAKLMSFRPDYEAFGLFQSLHVKNLLYYQVELSSLEHSLERIERVDQCMPSALAREDENMFHKYADTLIDSDTDQWDVILKVRRCLKEYDEALLQYSRVSALPHPRSRNVSSLLEWMVSPLAANFKIAGRGSGIWRDKYNLPYSKQTLSQKLKALISNIFTKDKSSTRQDLIAPRATKTADGLTLWLEDVVYLLTTVYKKLTTLERDGVEIDLEEALPVAGHKEDIRDLKLEFLPYYKAGFLLPAISKSVTFTACMLPIAAIAVLLNMKTLPRQIALIAGFTAIFTFGLMMLTGITRAQVFTATCAFLAVLVVFVATPGQ